MCGSGSGCVTLQCEHTSQKPGCYVVDQDMASPALAEMKATAGGAAWGTDVYAALSLLATAASAASVEK